MQIGKPGRRRQPHQPGLSRPGRGAGARPLGDLMGTAELHRVLPPAAHRRRADRGPALLPRPAARRDRRARDDADQRRRADDARRRPRLAAGRRRGRDPRLRPGHPRHVRGVRAAARGGAGAGGRRRRPAAVAASIARAIHAAGGKAAGLRPSGAHAARPARRADPRARRRARGERRRTSLLARALRDAVAEAWGRPLTMNVSMPIAAVMLDLGFPAAGGEGGADPRAHGRACSPTWPRSSEQPIGFLMAARRRRRSSYERAGERLMLAPEVEARPWAEQLALDDAPTARSSPTSSSARPSTARSWPRRASTRPRRPAGSPRSRSCRSPRSSELRATVHAGQPDRRAPLRGAGARSSGSTRRAARPARRATSR